MLKDYCINCKRKNHCCVFEDSDSGFVFVGFKDAEKIKKYTKKEFNQFLDYKKLSKKFIDGLKDEDPSLEGYMRYKQIINGRITALKTKENGDCIFLNKYKKCSIYKIRPNICRMYPYWAIILKDKKIMIINHDHESNCEYLKKEISIEEKYDLMDIFRKIKSEEKNYKRDMIKFSQRL